MTATNVSKAVIPAFCWRRLPSFPKRGIWRICWERCNRRFKPLPGWIWPDWGFLRKDGTSLWYTRRLMTAPRRRTTPQRRCPRTGRSSRSSRRRVVAEPFPGLSSDLAGKPDVAPLGPHVFLCLVLFLRVLLSLHPRRGVRVRRRGPAVERVGHLRASARGLLFGYRTLRALSRRSRFPRAHSQLTVPW